MHVSFDFAQGDIVSINRLTLILKIISQYDVKNFTLYFLTNKNNHVSFESLDIHYD